MLPNTACRLVIAVSWGPELAGAGLLLGGEPVKDTACKLADVAWPVAKDEDDNQTKVTCVKKHFLQDGNRILLINGLNDTRVESKIVSVVSEKAFKLGHDVELDCDAYYVVKLLSRNDQDSYVCFGIFT